MTSGDVEPALFAKNIRLDDPPGEIATLTGDDSTVAPRVLLQLN